MFENYDFSPAYIPTDRNTLPVYNPTGSTIPACTAVVLTGRTVLNSGGYEQVIFGVIPATEDFGVWGITAECIASGTTGSIVLNGVVRAIIAGGGGEYAIPGKNGLLASASGKHRILYPGNENNPGWVMMNYHNGAAGYSGTFKLRYIQDRTFEIYNGAYPEITSLSNSNYAGSTDLPGVEKVPRQFLTLPEDQTQAEVTLYACCNHGVYSVAIQVSSQALPEGAFTSRSIGNIYENGNVYQSYISGGTITFGRDWFL